MPRYKLDLDLSEADFLLIGICSQSRDYRLVWHLNQHMRLNFKRENDISDKPDFYSCFSCVDGNTGLKYYLCQNKNKGKTLFKEFQQIDFVLAIEGKPEHEEFIGLMKKIKKSEAVLAVYKLDPELVRHKLYLISNNT